MSSAVVNFLRMGGNLKEKTKYIIIWLTSGGAIRAFSMVVESFPYRERTTTLVISIATPFYENKILTTQIEGHNKV